MKFLPGVARAFFPSLPFFLLFTVSNRCKKNVSRGRKGSSSCMICVENGHTYILINNLLTLFFMLIIGRLNKPLHNSTLAHKPCFILIHASYHTNFPYYSDPWNDPIQVFNSLDHVVNSSSVSNFLWRSLYIIYFSCRFFYYNGFKSNDRKTSISGLRITRKLFENFHYPS